MVNVDAGGGDRLALAVLAQYRMATTEQLHLLIAPGVRVEQTRRRMAKLRGEGLVDRVTLAQAGRTRVWFVTEYGAQVAAQLPELRDWQAPRLASDRTAVRLKAGHGLTVTEVGLAFVQDARRRGEVCRPLDWIPEVYHPLGNGEAVIPDGLLYYRTGSDEEWSMLRAFVEVDRAAMGPERLAAKISAYTGTAFRPWQSLMKNVHGRPPRLPPGGVAVRPLMVLRELHAGVSVVRWCHMYAWMSSRTFSKFLPARSRGWINQDAAQLKEGVSTKV
ncbi:replication-relaxation family protein [Streptomyces sp. IB201691-2A2]|uniref:replication-relaxation family protein n=1 Tax=Streptomyces sp. IB201691-2A2 TaxID=2561920 RepID=UPI00117E3E55|nr:replication-relaxation family protein [Streptomyces sp. IB201691-2A2]TRO56069.1 hypothetical protein E4K73_48180 [Streptomyces sp. IB201691-2A2]